MNNLLDLRLPLSGYSNKGRVGPANLRKNDYTDVEKVEQLINELKYALSYYHEKKHYVDGVLIDVHYNDITAKSKRLKALFKVSGHSVNDFIVGVRFSDHYEYHIITYYLSEEQINEGIEVLNKIKIFLMNVCDGKADANNFNEEKGKKPIKDKDYYGYGFSKTVIRQLVVDCSVLNHILVPHIQTVSEQDSYVITFFKTELDTKKLMSQMPSLGRFAYTDLGDRTISVSKEVYQLLKQEVPYLISMAISDINELPIEHLDRKQKADITIPSPSNEPVIGVIDTLFSEDVYFHEWVEYHNEMDHLPQTLNKHGCLVTSIIVDGPQLNPHLDDHCGRFKVRHFGVCNNKINISTLTIKIKEIIKNNLDIHVWNLSLGSKEEISQNFMSYLAAVIDELQYQYNIIFVISGTNDTRRAHDHYMKIGSPADCLNAIVVNSVKMNGEAASYSRRGNVLGFFHKPDVAYYGGDCNERINACGVDGLTQVYGTSFASPWIARKLCFLIDVMKFPIEIAKALIIDSAAGWQYQQHNYKYQHLLGYGVVPIDIHDVVSSSNDEIKFYIYDQSSAYQMFNFQIPMLKDKDGNCDYIARATMCYFPHASRWQGVDYTDRELSLKFGRMDGRTVKDINKNVQDQDEHYATERQSRSEYRKWDNTKFLSSLLRNNRPSKAYDGYWGLTVTSKERLTTHMKNPLNFGIVITLKELSGKNRMDEFIQSCQVHGYIVHEVDINTRVEVYNESQSELRFE